MENQNVEEVEITDEDINEEDFSEELLNDDNTDWKAEALKLKGLNKRRATKLKKLKETPKPKEPENKEKKPEKKKEGAEPMPKKEGFDYGELAFLEGREIVDEEDQEFLFKEIETTGKSLKDVVGFSYIKEELKNRKEKREAANALPKGGKPAGSSGVNTKEYWIAKLNAGTAKLSDIKDVKLQREVNNARSQASRDATKFTDEPVVGG